MALSYSILSSDGTAYAVRHAPVPYEALGVRWELVDNVDQLPGLLRLQRDEWVKQFVGLCKSVKA